MRHVVLRFPDVTALELALDDGALELALPDVTAMGVEDGERVLAVVEMGGRKYGTATTARVVVRGASGALQLGEADWDTLRSFASARSQRMRAAPSSSPVPFADAVSSSSPSSSRPPRSALPPSGPPRAETPFPSSVRTVTVGARVLVASADAASLASLRVPLEGAGLMVERAATAAEARARLGVGDVDVLLVDWELDAGEGAELVRWARSGGSAQGVPILLLARHATTRSLIDAFAAGADDLVREPFHPPALGAKVVSLLRRARALGGDVAPGSGPTR